MSIVKINAIDVPGDKGEVLEERFAHRARAVDSVPGFEGFELLRPTDGRDTYFVYTRWESEEAFRAWREGEAFETSHGQHRDQGPVGTGSELLEFEVIVSTP